MEEGENHGFFLVSVLKTSARIISDTPNFESWDSFLVPCMYLFIPGLVALGLHRMEIERERERRRERRNKISTMEFNVIYQSIEMVTFLFCFLLFF
jgi:hypothetical protein